MTITVEPPGNIDTRPFERVRRGARMLVSRYMAQRRERLTEIEINKLSERERRDLGLPQQDRNFSLEQSSRR